MNKFKAHIEPQEDFELIKSIKSSNIVTYYKNITKNKKQIFFIRPAKKSRRRA